MSTYNPEINIELLNVYLYDLQGLIQIADKKSFSICYNTIGLDINTPKLFFNLFKIELKELILKIKKNKRYIFFLPESLEGSELLLSPHIPKLESKILNCLKKWNQERLFSFIIPNREELEDLYSNNFDSGEIQLFFLKLLKLMKK